MTMQADRQTTGALELADHVVSLVRARAGDAEVEVTVRQGVDALTRFATGFIHQNVASEVNHVLIRVALDGRNASTSVDGPADDETLGRAIDGVLEAARVRPAGPGLAGARGAGAGPGRRPLGRRHGRGLAGRAGRAGSGRSSTRPAAWRRPASARRCRCGWRSPTAPASG